jgi:lipoate-protein ligase A
MTLRRAAAVLCSERTCVFENLALEEWLLRHALEKHHVSHVLLLYRNSPSVVIGRNQNPWTETNLWLLAQLEAADGSISSGGTNALVQPFLARRFSGGGAVVHDLGNLNFSFISPKSDFNRRGNVEWLANTLRGAFRDLHLEINQRNDILCDGFKVSGSAYRLTGDVALHHGTLLIRSDLGRLRGLLTPTTRSESSGIAAAHRRHAVAKLAAETGQVGPSTRWYSPMSAGLRTTFADVRGTPSVRARVGNLIDMVPSMDVDRVAQLCVRQFRMDFDAKVLSVAQVDWDAVREIADRLADPQWILGETPAFRVKVEGVSLCPDLHVEVELCARRKGGWIDDIALSTAGSVRAAQTTLDAVQAALQEMLAAHCRLDGWAIRTSLRRWLRDHARDQSRPHRDYLRAIGEALADCLPPVQSWLENQRARARAAIACNHDAPSTSCARTDSL